MLDDAYGVFVASAADLDGGGPASEAGIAAGDGTAQHPFATIAQGLANLGRKTRVYVCNGTYREPVRITTAVSVYGGLSCAGAATAGRIWSYAGQSAQVTSPSPTYALSVAGVDGGSVTIEDMSFASPDATEPGSSSLAALIASSTVDLRRVTLRAGHGANGADGADGDATPNYAGLAPSGGPQIVPPTPDAGTLSPGQGALNQCLAFGGSVGGNGALGCASGPDSPGLGVAGTATPAAPTILAGRDGQPHGAILADGGTVANNDPGADGVAGDGGQPALRQDVRHPVTERVDSERRRRWRSRSPGPRRSRGHRSALRSALGMCGNSTESIGGGGGGAGGCGGSGGRGGGGGGGEHCRRQRRKHPRTDGLRAGRGSRRQRRRGGLRSGRPRRRSGGRHEPPRRARGGSLRRQWRRRIRRSRWNGRHRRRHPRVRIEASRATWRPCRMPRRASRAREDGPGWAAQHGVGTLPPTGMDGQTGASGRARDRRVT